MTELETSIRQLLDRWSNPREAARVLTRLAAQARADVRAMDAALKLQLEPFEVEYRRMEADHG